jgi:hypothetical protein
VVEATALVSGRNCGDFGRTFPRLGKTTRLPALPAPKISTKFFPVIPPVGALYCYIELLWWRHGRRTSQIPCTRAVSRGRGLTRRRGLRTMEITGRGDPANRQKRTRFCDIDTTFQCGDVNCIRRMLCSRVELAKRRMLAHDGKSKRGRRIAWGSDYIATTGPRRSRHRPTFQPADVS